MTKEDVDLLHANVKNAAEMRDKLTETLERFYEDHPSLFRCRPERLSFEEKLKVGCSLVTLLQKFM